MQAAYHYRFYRKKPLGAGAGALYVEIRSCASNTEVSQEKRLCQVTIQQRFIKMAKSLRISHPKKSKCHFTKGLFFD
jgi:hypothetical protein